jgi:hypothetical protein
MSIQIISTQDIIPSEEVNNLFSLYKEYNFDKDNCIISEAIETIIKAKIYQIIMKYMKTEFSKQNKATYLFEHLRTNRKIIIRATSTQELLYKIYMNNTFNILDSFMDWLESNLIENIDKPYDLYHQMYVEIFDNSDYQIEIVNML